MTLYGHVGLVMGPSPAPTPRAASAPAVPPSTPAYRPSKGIRSISYCICCFRPKYDALLIEDLIRKTTAPYEILLWINTPDGAVAELAARKAADGHPVRVVGNTPENIGMAAFKELFKAAQGDMVVQMDDDVLCISRRIAETAATLFRRYPQVRQLVADVCQDRWTNGARPPMSVYKPYAPTDGLYDGPIDGWFSIYRREILHVLMEAPFSRYCYLGSFVRARLPYYGLRGMLCTRFKVFHATGPAYAAFFGSLENEIRKYASVGRPEIVRWYEEAKTKTEDMVGLGARFEEIRRELDAEVPA